MDGEKPSNLPLLFNFWRGGGNSHPFFLEGKNEGNVPAKIALPAKNPFQEILADFGWHARATPKSKAQGHV